MKQQPMSHFPNILVWLKEGSPEKKLAELETTFPGEQFTVVQIREDKPALADRVHGLYLQKLVKKGSLPVEDAMLRRSESNLKPVEFEVPEKPKNEKQAAAVTPAVEPETVLEDRISGVQSIEVDVDKIIVSDQLFRQVVQNLETLAESIATFGVLEPIFVNQADNSLVVGKRRLFAARLAGRKTIPAKILTLSPQEIYDFQGVENSQREQWTTWEVLNYIHAGIEFGRSQVQLSRVMGIAGSNLSNMVKVIKKIPEDVLNDLKRMQPDISMDALIGLTDLEEQAIRSFVSDFSDKKFTRKDVEEQSSKKETSKKAKKSSTPEEEFQDGPGSEMELNSINEGQLAMVLSECIRALNVWNKKKLNEETIRLLDEISTLSLETINAQ